MKTVTLFLLLLSINAQAATCNGNSFLQYPEQYRIAYVAGVWDTMEFMSDSIKDEGSKKFIKCIGPSTKMSQLSDALKNHYELHPESRLHLCSEELLHVAVKVWKCNK